jgi:hypothetical protein
VLIAAANVIIDRKYDDALLDSSSAFGASSASTNGHHHTYDESAVDDNSTIGAGAFDGDSTSDWSPRSSHRQPRIVTLPIGGQVVCGAQNN